MEYSLGGRMILFTSTFVSPSMPLPNLIRMCYCGYVPNNIPPYKILRPCNVAHLKQGKIKLSNMKIISSHVERGAKIVNQTALIKIYQTVAHTFSLYHAAKHLFMFHQLRVGKKRRYEKIPWEIYYNIFSKRKGDLMGEGQE